MEVCNKAIIDDTYRELYEKDSIITKELIEDVVDKGQSLFAYETIMLGTFETVSYPYLGKLKARHRYIQQMNQNLKIKKSRTTQTCLTKHH